MPLLIVGTFNTAELFTVHFDTVNERLQLLNVSEARGNHSWLSTTHLPSSDGVESSTTSPTHLYATCWTEPPSVAAYRISRTSATSESRGDTTGATLELINTAETASRSGYVCIGTPKAGQHPVLYTVGGPTGEVIGIDADNAGFDLVGKQHVGVIHAKAHADQTVGLGPAGRLQELDFVTGRCSFLGKTLAESRKADQGDASQGKNASNTTLDAANGKNAMDFGGLRHGSHGIDLSPDGSICFVPDIGRNCVWVYDVDPTNGSLKLAEKSLAPRPNDGPRHTISHPAGKYVYSLQEHSSMVDVFEVVRGSEGTNLTWKEGVKIIPSSHDASDYWADEVRLSCASIDHDGCFPRYLFASTRGLKQDTKGWVAVFELDQNGLVVPAVGRDKEHGKAVCMWETPTSGGWANAIEPAPFLTNKDGNIVQYAALTDSEAGVVRMLRLTIAKHQTSLEEVATLQLGNDSCGKLREAATAVWI